MTETLNFISMFLFIAMIACGALTALLAFGAYVAEGRRITDNLAESAFSFAMATILFAVLWAIFDHSMWIDRLYS